MHTYWANAFPPHGVMASLKWFLLQTTGQMAAYPLGAERGGSIVTAALVIAGIVLWTRQREIKWLVLLLAPLALNLFAAVLHRYPFGGSCLPKDLRAITYKAREVDVDTPLLSSIMLSNRQQIDRAVDMVLRTRRKRIGVLGMSFKTGTDDLRESPMVTLIETLIGKGLQLTIYDREVELAQLFGANKHYIEHEIPHISSLIRSDLNEVIDGSEVVIIGKHEDEYRALSDRLGNGRVIIDLVRLLEVSKNENSYQGVCW